MWCSGHSQAPGASAVLAALGTASAGPSCGGRSLEGSASPALLARGTAGEGRPEEDDGSWGPVLSGQSWDSPAFLQLVVHRPANAREDEGASATTHTLSPRGLKSTIDVGSKLA